MKDTTPAALFGPVPDLRPMSHRDDPSTSREAARKHVESGSCGTNIELVLALARRHPGKTACELWKLATPDEQYKLGDYYEVRRRLGNLADPPEPKIKRGESRVCGVKGTRQLTWEPI